MSVHDNTHLVNKVIYYGETLIDISTDTVAASDVQSGKYFHLPTGERVQGTCTYDADTSDATALAGEILSSKSAYVNGNKLTGNMPNIGQQTSSISAVAQSVQISEGYHDGSGSVAINSTEQAKIVAGNIKSGVQILGVTGNYTGDEIAQEHSTIGSATPGTTSQVILPSSYNVDPGDDYLYFTQFTVNAVPYTETSNAAGGYTVTIGIAS